MKALILTLLFFCFIVSPLRAQKHSLGLSINSISNVHRFDRRSDFDEYTSTPYFRNIALDGGLIYSYKFKESDFRFHFGLVKIGSPMSIRRERVGVGDTRVNGDNFTAMQSGLGYDLGIGNAKWITFTLGYAFRRIRKPIGRSSPYVSSFVTSNCIEGCFRSFVKTIYPSKGNFHSSIFLKTEIDLWRSKNGKNKLSLNLIGNIGLHIINQKRSLIYYTDKGTKDILLNTNGTYYGVGLSYSRLSSDKFKDLFNFSDLKEWWIKVTRW